MIELERHIEILLLDNDCVIVPELGGFMTHYVSAHYDEKDQLYLPPLRTLGFNPQLTMNDSLLVQSYIEAYDISYPEALRRIENEVAELRQHLETKGEYELNDIGLLRLNTEGHLEFAPCEAGILTPELYGLSSIEVHRIEKKQSADVAIPSQKANSSKNAMKRKKHVSASVVKSDDDTAIIIKMSWLRNIAAVAAAVIAFFIYQTPVSNSNVMTDMQQQSSIVPITVMQNAKPELNRQTAPVPVEEIKAAPQAVNQTKSTYCIVLASQTTRDLAEAFVRQLSQKGYDKARIMNMQNTKRVRVVYGSYSTEAEAYTQMRQMRQQKVFNDAWVLKL